ncbi:MAG: hypothetical protein FWF76_03800 [Oscillospiraceae bacterium]|nr:hypothetical protein [Oscillospiraceae bacterium]
MSSTKKSDKPQTMDYKTFREIPKTHINEDYGNEYDKEQLRRMQQSLKLELKRKKLMGVPIAKWDKERKKAYLEHPDGTKEYVE